MESPTHRRSTAETALMRYHVTARLNSFLYRVVVARVLVGNLLISGGILVQSSNTGGLFHLTQMSHTSTLYL